jgi:hypothetical protein
MPDKSASKRVKTPVVAKSARANGAKRRAKKVHLSKLEAERLEKFKALILKYRGKATFAGFDG